MDVLIVEPLNPPRKASISGRYESFKKIVGGDFETISPFNDLVTIVCNQKGKINGLPLNRAIYDRKGNIVDIIAGTFLICGLNEDNYEFVSLSSELMKKYQKEFNPRESFLFHEDGSVTSISLDLTKDSFEL